MNNYDEKRYGIKLELMRMMLGQSYESFCELADIDKDDYKECISFSDRFYDVDLNTLFRMYYILDVVISSEYISSEIKYIAIDIITVVKQRTDEFLNAERHVAGCGEGVPAVFEAEIILNSTNTIPKDKINTIFRAYYIVSDIIRSSKPSDPFFDFCRSVKKSAGNGIENYVNKTEGSRDSNNRNRN